MAVRLDAWIGTRNPIGIIAEPQPKSRLLTLEQRRARLHRRRRLNRAHTILESAVWLAGTAAVSVIAFAGIYGLR